MQSLPSASPSLSKLGSIHQKYRIRVSCSKTNSTPPDISVEVSAEMKTGKEVKLWGGRFEESVTDAVEKFSESVSFDKALYKHDIMGSRAHATMLAQQGLITVSDRDSILGGLDVIESRIESGEFQWRSDRKDVHMNIEAALMDMIGEPAKKLHTARSRNDQVVTDLRLWCRDAIDGILTGIKFLQQGSHGCTRIRGSGSSRFFGSMTTNAITKQRKKQENAVMAELDQKMRGLSDSKIEKKTSESA